jgi:prepilin-type processing-associated H-X9-DG protein
MSSWRHGYCCQLGALNTNFRVTSSGWNGWVKGLTAFTLVELVTVVGIIGILAAFLLEGISGAKGRALRIQCVNNSHQLGTGLQTFIADNHGYPVLWTSTNKSAPISDRFWIGQLEREGLGDSRPAMNFFQKGVWFCPSARWSASMQRALAEAGHHGAYYGYNDDMLGQDLRAKNSTNQFGLQGHYDPVTHSFQPITESEVAVPSEMMAIGENFDASIIFMRRNVGSLARFSNIVTRHQGKANVVFCDGHVESPTVGFLFDDTSDTALARWNRDHQPHRELAR